MIKKYKKKPVLVDAIQLSTKNYEEVCEFVGSTLVQYVNPAMPISDDGAADPYLGVYIETLEGRMLASLGDFIIKGVNGEFYPCKPDVFFKTYEEVV